MSLLRAPAATARRGARWTDRWSRNRRRIIGAETAAAAAAAAIEHGQGRIEALQHHLGRVFLDAGLVGPFAGLQLAFDVNLGALLQILLGDLAQAFVEDHHAVPLGLFLALAGRLVAPGFRRRDAADWRSAARPGCAGFRDPCRDCRPESPCSRFPPSPLSTLEIYTVNPPPARLAAIAVDHLNRPYTLAVRRARRSRLSTYSIAARNVPVLFRIFHSGDNSRRRA